LRWPWVGSLLCLPAAREERTRTGAESDDVATFVAVIAGRHVGTATGLYFDEQAPAELVALWVEPHVQRRGIGKALVERVCQWAIERGAGSIQLDLNGGNPAARRLYESSGFVLASGPAPASYNASRDPAALSLGGHPPLRGPAVQSFCHIEHADRHLDLVEFLDVSGEPPMRRCAEAIVAALGNSGSVLT
jgi:GNAT superfamily N-acetyltransferase